MKRNVAPIIGLVGGVGSGKSAVARWLVNQHHGQLVDADVIGHQVLLRDDVKRELREAFGDPIFNNGEIDRGRLAAIVFGGGPEQAAARATLEGIVHPVLGDLIRDQMAAARQDEAVGLIVFDAAILLESGWRDVCDVVAFVDVPREQRLSRIAPSRGWTEEELSRRESSQWPLIQKQQASDIVIDNSGTVEQAGRQLEGYLIDEGWLPPLNQKADHVSDAGSSILNRV